MATAIADSWLVCKIESVIQLREADRKEEARRLVRTYVVSQPICPRCTCQAPW